MCKEDICNFDKIKKTSFTDAKGKKWKEGYCGYGGNDWDGLCSCEACEFVNNVRRTECYHKDLSHVPDEYYLNTNNI